MDYIANILTDLAGQSAFSDLTYKNLIMIIVACFFLYLAIAKEYEPLLLVPIAFGMLLVNLFPGIMAPPSVDIHGNDVAAGLLYYFYLGDLWGIFPSLIFMGVGAMTDFGPLIANPKSVLLGAAAQFGIFATFLGAVILKFPAAQASAPASSSGSRRARTWAT